MVVVVTRSTCLGMQAKLHLLRKNLWRKQGRTLAVTHHKEIERLALPFKAGAVMSVKQMMEVSSHQLLWYGVVGSMNLGREEGQASHRQLGGWEAGGVLRGCQERGGAALFL